MAGYSVPVAGKNIYRIPDLMLKIAFTAVFAVLMAVSANAFIYLPFTPVPITLQVLTVIFSALMLGGTWAAASQLIYILMGLSGLPVFAGFLGGPAVLMGPTGGYIIGFVAAAYITGTLAHKKYKLPGYVIQAAAAIAGLAVIYTIGALHLYGFLYALSPAAVSYTVKSVWIMGIKPFILLDLAKILAAIIILRPGAKRI